MEKNEEKTADRLEQLLHESNRAYTEFCNGQKNCMVCRYGEERPCTLRFIAEYLAENGVTV